MSSKHYLQGATQGVVLLCENPSGDLIPLKGDVNGRVQPSPFVLNGGTSLPVAETIAKASAVLVSDDTNVSNNKVVVIGDVTYTFKTSLSTGPAVPYEVKIGADAATSLANLQAAINASTGAGTKYGTGTGAHPQVSAPDTAAGLTPRQTIEARADYVITAIPVSTDDDHLTWGEGVTATTTGTGRKPLPATGGVIVIKNVGADTCYVALGGASVEASTEDYPIFAGHSEVLGLADTQTYLAAVCGSGDTTTLNLMVGDGQPVFAGA